MHALFNYEQYLNLSLQQSYTKNENEKKRHYNERILQVDHGLFTLLFLIYGGMWREYRRGSRSLNLNITKFENDIELCNTVSKLC